MRKWLGGRGGAGRASTVPSTLPLMGPGQMGGSRAGSMCLKGSYPMPHFRRMLPLSPYPPLPCSPLRVSDFYWEWFTLAPSPLPHPTHHHSPQRPLQ